MSFPANVIPVFGSQRAYADLNFSGGSFGLDGRIVNDLTALPGFTFTRASLAMGYDATGKLTYGPNNLCLQSNTFSNASWTKINGGAGSAPTVTSGFTDPDGGTLAWRLQASSGGVGGADYSVLRQTSSGAPSAIRSLYVKSNTGSSQSVYFGNPNNSTPVTATTSWTRVSYKDGTANNFIDVGAYPAAASGTQTVDILICYAQLEAVTYQTTPSTYYPTTTAAYYGPRLVYDPVTLASLGILVEEARTNICLQSSDFSTTWATGGTVTVNATTSPDGTSNADLVTSTGSVTLAQDIVLSATTGTYSIYAKKSTGATQANRFGIRNVTTATDLLFITFNYDTGGITYNTGASGATATNVGNGWWRIELTVSSGITSGNTLRLYAGFVGAATSGQAGFFWQAQLEAAVGASSPIPTTTAAVTRAADTAYVGGLAMSYPLTLNVEVKTGFSVSTSSVFAQVDNGGTSQRVLMSISGATIAQVISAGGGGGTALANVAGTLTTDTAYKLAARALVNDVAIARGGTVGTTDTTFDYPAAPTQISIGWNTSGQQLNGTISRIRIYNRALTDAQLQSLTS